MTTHYIVRNRSINQYPLSPIYPQINSASPQLYRLLRVHDSCLLCSHLYAHKTKIHAKGKKKTREKNKTKTKDDVSENNNSNIRLPCSISYGKESENLVWEGYIMNSIKKWQRKTVLLIILFRILLAGYDDHCCCIVGTRKLVLNQQQFLLYFQLSLVICSR